MLEKKGEGLVVYEKIIEGFCVLIVLAQSLLYLGISFEMVDPWIFPSSVLFLGSVILGGIFGIVGIGLLIKRKFRGEAVRLQSVFVCSLSFVILVFVQALYGFQNIDFTKGNDYSTDVVDVPQYQFTKQQRLRSQKVIPLWSFMDIPHKILKSDSDSMVLPVSGLTSKIILKKALNDLGWLVTRRAVSTSKGGGFIETYEITGGLNGTPRRTDLAVRIVSDNGSFSVIDIRSSSPGRRRDLGFNEIMIQKLSEDIFKVATSFTL